ncbi:MAG TPA: hypothetical protein VEN81_09570 [Planctomycetota bacterium]|nr:hypothetical protein [Planctomycetota bacterium]
MIEEFKAIAAPVTLTQENHPENLPEPAAAPQKKSRLGRTIAVSILGGLIGMAYGVTALSSALDSAGAIITLLPLVIALVVLEAGYWGAIVCMCQDEVGD